MRKVFVPLLLCSWVVLVRAGLVDRLRESSSALHSDDSDERPLEKDDVLSLIDSLAASLMEQSQQRSDSWYSRYDALAKAASNNSAAIAELSGISSMALPIIWDTSLASYTTGLEQYHSRVHFHRYFPSDEAHVSHPLKAVQSDLRDSDDFLTEVTLKANQETNVGLKFMYEQEEGQDLEEGDVYVGFQVKWPGEDCTNGEMIERNYGGDEWTSLKEYLYGGSCPNLVVGEKFILIFVKEDGCVSLGIRTGADRFYPEFSNNSYHYYTCPLKKVEHDPRKLMIVIEEENAGSGQVEVHQIVALPTSD